MNETLQTFDFSEQPVRILMRQDNPWFCAADVCRILEISNARDAMTALDEDEVCAVSRSEMTVGNTDGQKNRGGAQTFNLISESGLYALVFKSRKAEAKRFRKWVTAEVLPALRRTGRYGLPSESAELLRARRTAAGQAQVIQDRCDRVSEAVLQERMGMERGRVVHALGRLQLDAARLLLELAMAGRPAELVDGGRRVVELPRSAALRDVN
jgi:prophage antirepressor-like protein